MRTRYYTEFPQDGTDWQFARSDPSGIERLESGAALPSGADLVIFVPGTEVSAHRVRATARRPAELMRMATFAIEDDLAVPVESVHVAVAPEPDADGTRLVYSVSQALMGAWMDRMTAAGLSAARLVPDLSVLPAGQHVDLGTHQLLAAGNTPLAIDNHWPSDVMAALQREAGGSAAPRPVDRLSQLAEWAETQSRLTDLRQGAYARPSESPLSLRQFRLPAALAAGLLVAWSVQAAWSVHAMNQLTNALNAETQRLYAAAFPGVSVPANPAAALRSQAGTPSGASAPSFQQTSAALYGAIAGLDGTTLVSVRYDRAMGELRATLTYPAFGADLDLKQAVEETGLRVNLGDTRLEDGRVVGDLAIGGVS